MKVNGAKLPIVLQRVCNN